jgi:hypothetical protein
MAHDDVAAERVRLEAVAWGAGSSPADAARARIALQDLEHGRRPRGGARVAGRDERPGGPDRVPALGAPSRRPAPTPGSAPAVDVRSVAVAPDRATVAGPAGADDGSGARDGRAAEDGTGGGGTDRVEDGAGDGGGDPGLPAVPTRRSRWRTLLWTRRPRAWIAAGAVAAVGVAFAAGTVVGTTRPDVAAAPSITPTVGTVTLEQLLDVPQTYADQLPGPVEAPVNLRTTRLVFTNRALDGGTLNTPWNVWAGVGTDRSTICLIATADRIESSTACFPRQAALHGSVSMSAQSMSGTLTIALRGGGVQGRVTNAS